jgi:hypothetical protein
MRVLYISGYPYETAGFDRLNRKPAFLSKPFPPNLLALRVRELLNQGSRGRTA